MPEICEVALTADILSKYFKGKILLAFDFVSGRYTNTSPVGFDTFTDALPLKVVKIDSKGKFLWFELVDRDDKKIHWFIWNTLGLTGMWSLFEAKYTRAILTFDNGRAAYFSDMRNFGTFKFSDDPLALDKKLNSLGFDFLKNTDFNLSALEKYNEPIVKTLMDQKKVGSGLGNYLVAEILYRAKISPHRISNEITANEIKKLTYWIKYLVKLCYTNNYIGYMVNLEDEAKKIPRKNYHPDIDLGKKKFKFAVYNQKTDPKGNKVIADKIIRGRTTYWVPAVQK